MPDPPLAAARQRLIEAERRKRRATKAVGPSDRAPVGLRPDVVIGMAAAGVPQQAIGAAFGASQPAVAQMLDRIPGGREEIKQLREALKLMKIRALHRTTPYLLARLAHEIGTPDPADPAKWIGGEAKDVDAVMRAVQAGERTEGLASGEAQRVEVDLPPVPPQQEVKLLIQQFLAPR